MIVIGYQGMENSNNNTAAALLSQKLDGPAELRPLVSSRNVVAALLAGEIDYGVMAISTDVAGEVAETREARKGTALRQLDAVSLDIHHSLFKKSPQIATEKIRTIASHPEALRECAGNVAKVLPDAAAMPVGDTALAAKMLHDGELSDDTAVLCSTAAGKQHGLCLIQENIEDLEHNGTAFALFAR